MKNDRSELRARDARALFRAAVRGASADALLEDFAWNEAAPRSLSRYRRVRLVAVGKAALAMTGAATQQLRQAGVSLDEGVVVVPEGYASTLPERFPSPPPGAEVVEGGHPTPTEASVRAGERALQLAGQSAAGDLLIVLLSGGGTALCNAFARGISLADARRTYRLLLESGTGIHAMNAVRKHLSRVGGGQLARAAQPADTLALAISDVPGDDLSVIASGPAVPDPATFADAGAVIEEKGLRSELPGSVRRHIERGLSGSVEETPKPGAALFRHVCTRLIGGNGDALHAAQVEAERRGYACEQKEEALSGEARHVGTRLAREAVRAANTRAASAPPCCWLLGGETTVTVRGNGTGGRNQELALAAALALDGTSAPVAVLSAGTDGIDGPTDAAGAVVMPGTVQRIRDAGLDPQARLADNDAHLALDAAGALIQTGPTHTNVMDVAAVLMGAG